MAVDPVVFHFDSPHASPGYLLGQLTMLWQRKQKRVLDPFDLTHTQFVLLATLAWLSKSNNDVTQIDISRQSNADKMMVSKVLRTLEEKGFVTRKEHKTDTRAKTICLTDAGINTLQKAIVQVEAADLEFFSFLNAKGDSFNSHMLTLIEANSKAISPE